jgi:hypothetical protein
MDRRIRKLESMANLAELMRQYVDDHGNDMAKPTDPLQVLAWVIRVLSASPCDYDPTHERRSFAQEEQAEGSEAGEPRSLQRLRDFAST